MATYVILGSSMLPLPLQSPTHDTALGNFSLIPSLIEISRLPWSICKCNILSSLGGGVGGRESP